MKLFKRNQQDAAPSITPRSRTPIFAALAVELPLPTWDDTEAVPA
ncbi:hypothetical protein [Rhodococcus spongiicola]|nr:hypothetical protein [Rhodococcus spongiicola]